MAISGPVISSFAESEHRSIFLLRKEYEDLSKTKRERKSQIFNSTLIPHSTILKSNRGNESNIEVIAEEEDLGGLELDTIVS